MMTNSKSSRDSAKMKLIRIAMSQYEFVVKTKGTISGTGLGSNP
jgi:hypothetical protein